MTFAVKLKTEHRCMIFSHRTLMFLWLIATGFGMAYLYIHLSTYCWGPQLIVPVRAQTKHGDKGLSNPPTLELLFKDTIWISMTSSTKVLLPYGCFHCWCCSYAIAPEDGALYLNAVTSNVVFLVILTGSKCDASLRNCFQFDKRPCHIWLAAFIYRDCIWRCLGGCLYYEP